MDFYLLQQSKKLDAEDTADQVNADCETRRYNELEWVESVQCFPTKRAFVGQGLQHFWK